MKLYMSNIMSVLLYSSECGGVVQKDMYKSDTFHNSCLCKIYWLQKSSNEYLYKKTGCQIRRPRWFERIQKASREA